ncbi:MAG: dihydrodipicolinate synthase family protein [Candidatus Shikimatogenerans sp. JK-2022]|nr:dihydrodipicolinate synthase family protein [Candidatus Shikimatogenerans bostrichidophilus]
MKNIKINIPLITPLDNKNNIDFFSLEKLITYISNYKVDNLILFDKFSENITLSINEKIDIINCIFNNNIKNINIILKINNLYNYNDLIDILNQKLYKNIYCFILDYPNLSYLYNNEIIKNYNKIFKNFKYLYFYLNFNKYNNFFFDENIFIELKKKNKNFLGIINKTKYIFNKYNLVNKLEIFINNDIYLFKNIYNINGIISPLFLFFFDYINNNIILNIKNYKNIIYDLNYYNLVKFINYLYNYKLNPLFCIKYLLEKLNICKKYIRKPCNNFEKFIKYYKKLKKIYNTIII